MVASRDEDLQSIKREASQSTAKAVSLGFTYKQNKDGGWKASTIKPDGWAATSGEVKSGDLIIAVDDTVCKGLDLKVISRSRDHTLPSLVASSRAPRALRASCCCRRRARGTCAGADTYKKQGITRLLQGTEGSTVGLRLQRDGKELSVQGVRTVVPKEGKALASQIELAQPKQPISSRVKVVYMKFSNVSRGVRPFDNKVPRSAFRTRIGRDTTISDLVEALRNQRNHDFISFDFGGVFCANEYCANVLATANLGSL